MQEYSQKQKPAPSRFMKGFGAVKPKHKPENDRLIWDDMEQAIAAEVMNETQTKKPKSRMPDFVIE
jgi:hypothetical protein